MPRRQLSWLQSRKEKEGDGASGRRVVGGDDGMGMGT